MRGIPFSNVASPDFNEDGAQIRYTDGYLFGSPVVRVGAGIRPIKLALEYTPLLGIVDGSFGGQHRLGAMVDFMIGGKVK
ncbi:MAG: hypothetical protein GF350_14945 [Chitinivibrionales bacterium]|nr:hypothetical protein [Chitinivibrionales bacterium]